MPLKKGSKIIMWCFGVLLISLLLAVFIIVLAVKPPKHLHLYGSFSRIQCKPDTAGYRESFAEKVAFAPGMQGIGYGNFDMVMIIDSTTEIQIKNLDLISPYSGGTIPLGEHFPNDLKITPKDAATPIQLTLSMMDNDTLFGGILPVLLVTQPEDTENSENQEGLILTPPSEGWPNFYLLCPNEKIVTISIAKDPVRKYGGIGFSQEYLAETPQGGPLTPIRQIDSVRALILKFDDSVSIKPIVAIKSEAIEAFIKDAQITVGNTTKTGSFILRTEDTVFLPFIGLNSKTNLAFDIVVTPTSTADQLFFIQGGSRYFKIIGDEIKASLGGKKFILDRTERLELEGEFIFSLIFNQPQMPILHIDGKAVSVKINDEERLPSRWQSIDSNVRGPIVGAFIAAIAAILSAWLTAKLIQRKQSKKQNNS